MTGAQDFDSGAPDTAPLSRWPRVLGTIGVILGVIMFIDKLDDLVTRFGWSEEDWRRMFAPDVADLIVQAMPPVGWLVFSAVGGMVLALLLFIGSLVLRRRRRSGISLCRAWAWLAIVWTLLEIGRAIWWLERYAGDIPGVPLAAWQGFAAFGIAVALVIMLAYPVFLLVWFARGDIRAEYQEWPD